jgi:malonyl-CoA O-methyltransferase
MSSRVIALFDRRAANFAQADFLLAEIDDRLLSRLQLITSPIKHIVDVGCGVGRSAYSLLSRYPQAHYLGVDHSPRMIELAQAQYSSVASPLKQWVQNLCQRALRMLPHGVNASASHRQFLHHVGDDLPCSPESQDLIYSNLMLHWHPEPHRVFPYWHRALRVGGLTMFSCFGPDTCRELRQAYGEMGLSPDAATLQFVDLHDFGDMLVAAGFADPVMDMEKITLTYATPPKLLADLRILGGLPNPKRLGLGGKQYLHQLCAALEQQRRADTGLIHLTFEVIYGHAWKVAPKHTSRGMQQESIVTFHPKAPR